MTVQTPTRVGREYLRVSEDRSGHMRSPEQQHAEDLEVAAERGVSLGEPYKEKNGVSASRYSTKTRDAFDRLIDDLKADSFGADELWLWESSRGSRRVGEWVLLIDLCEERGVQIYVKTHGRLYDPGNGRDRRTLLEDAVDSEYESWKTSQRVSRDMKDHAAAGKPHGLAPYGFRAVYHERTGALITWEADPEKAPLIEELFKRVKAGDSFKAIERDWAARGIVNSRGNPFRDTDLRSKVILAAYAGKRVHHGEIIEGTWDGIVDDQLFYAVRRIVTDPKRNVNRNGRAVHAFSAVIRCDRCSGPLTVTYRYTVTRSTDGAAYQCAKGHTRIAKDEVDEILESWIFGYLSREDNYQELAGRRGDDPQVAKVAVELARLRAELDEMEAETAETLSEAKVLARSIEAKREKIAAAEARERELTTPSAIIGLIAPGPDVEKRWKDAPVSARRQAARILLSPDYLGEVRIRPADDVSRFRREDGTRMRQPAIERMIRKRER